MASTGTLDVPDVVGLTRSDAEQRLTGVGLVVGVVTPVSSNSVAKGSIVSTTPAAGISVLVLLRL